MHFRSSLTEDDEGNQWVMQKTICGWWVHRQLVTVRMKKVECHTCKNAINIIRWRRETGTSDRSQFINNNSGKTPAYTR